MQNGTFIDQHIFMKNNMKKVLLALLFVASGISLNAQTADADGIKFFSGSFEEAKKEAAAKKKLIFMDAYTVWCGPCKALSYTTFKEKAVGEYFYKNFINVKMDMEKGEGPALAQKYGVRAYPTLLFIDKDGKQVHMSLGYIPAAGLLEEGKKALALAK